jgi:hypothetical protein
MAADAEDHGSPYGIPNFEIRRNAGEGADGLSNSKFLRGAAERLSY